LPGRRASDGPADGCGCCHHRQRRGLKIREVSVATIYGEAKSKINPVTEPLRFLRLALRYIIGME